jgi:alkylation response protein AidB-like acyl-CoA dehydrogenase
LCGTGSNDFVIEDYRAPADQIAGTIIPTFADRPLYRFPRFGLLASPIAAICLGLARAAVRELVALATKKVPDGTTRSLATRSATQIAVAKAEASLRAARAYFYESIDAAHHMAQHAEPTTEHRLHVRLATTHAVKACAEIVGSMYELAGGSALYSSSPMQRIFRDVHAATQHMMVSTATLELTGRALLGLESDFTQL